MQGYERSRQVVKPGDGTYTMLQEVSENMKRRRGLWLPVIEYTDSRPSSFCPLLSTLLIYILLVLGACKIHPNAP